MLASAAPTDVFAVARGHATDLAASDHGHQTDFHPQLARGVAAIVHRISDGTGAGAVTVCATAVRELCSLLDRFAPSLQVAMMSVNVVFPALPLDGVPLALQCEWISWLAATQPRVSGFREAEAHINAARRFLEAPAPTRADGQGAGTPVLWSRALACALVPGWARALSPKSKHVGAQVAITVRNLCSVLSECSHAAESGTPAVSPAERLCAVVALNSTVSVVRRWTLASGDGTRAPAAPVPALARTGWQQELLTAAVHVLLDLLPPRCAGHLLEGSLCLAAAVGLSHLLERSPSTLHEIEAMRVMRAHGAFSARPAEQLAPPGFQPGPKSVSQRIVQSCVETCIPGKGLACAEAGLVLLSAIDGPLWDSLLAVVPGDALELAGLLQQLHWQDTSGRAVPLQPTMRALAERLLYGFMEHVCALHRDVCAQSITASDHLLLLPLLTTSELTRESLECATVFYTSAHNLTRGKLAAAAAAGAVPLLPVPRGAPASAGSTASQ